MVFSARAIGCWWYPERISRCLVILSIFLGIRLAGFLVTLARL
jgi:hypothetical protein